MYTLQEVHDKLKTFLGEFQDKLGTVFLTGQVLAILQNNCRRPPTKIALYVCKETFNTLLQDESFVRFYSGEKVLWLEREDIIFFETNQLNEELGKSKPGRILVSLDNVSSVFKLEQLVA